MAAKKKKAVAKTPAESTRGTKKSDRKKTMMDALRSKFLGHQGSRSSSMSNPSISSDIQPHVSAEEIVKAKYRNKHVVQTNTAADISSASADSVSSDVLQMKRKYFSDSTDSSSERHSVSSLPAREDTGIVNVASNDPSMDAGRIQPKSIVISDGVEIGEQG